MIIRFCCINSCEIVIAQQLADAGSIRVAPPARGSSQQLDQAEASERHRQRARRMEGWERPVYVGAEHWQGSNNASIV